MRRAWVPLTGIMLLASCGTVINTNPTEGTEIWEFEAGGEARTVLVHPPEGFQGPLPVLLAFHGGYGSAQGMDRMYGISALADREGFIGVYPQGIDLRWRDGRLDPGDLSDVLFIQQVVDSLVSRYPVDTGRIYATGMSNGAIFCHFLAVKMPGVLAGIAPVCGGIADPGVEWFSPSEAMDVLIIQCAADPLVPFGGGEIGRGRGSVLSTSEAVERWKTVNGSTGLVYSLRIPDTFPDDGCSASMDVYGGLRETALVTVEGGGHVWPGGVQYLPESVIGKACTDFECGEFLWEFFKEALGRRTPDQRGEGRTTEEGTRR